MTAPADHLPLVADVDDVHQGGVGTIEIDQGEGERLADRVLEHLEGCLDAAGVTLTDDVLDRIDDLVPAPT